MHAEADALHAQANRIDSAVAPLPDLVPTWTFLAPAGNRLRGHLREVHERSRRMAGVVHAAADALHAQARRLEQDIARWEEEKRAEDRRLEEERQRAQQKSSHR
jgi:hypothetical protein